MALIWMDNFWPESDAGLYLWPNITPYKQYFVDGDTSNGVLAQRWNGEGSIVPARSVNNNALSLRTLPVPNKSLPVTYTWGASIVNDTANASPNNTCQFGVIANTPDGPRVIFAIRPGNGAAVPGLLFYAQNGVRHTVPLIGNWSSSTNRTVRTNIEFAFEKVADNAVDTMSMLYVWVDNLVVFSGQVFNNAYSLDQLEVIVAGLVQPERTAAYLVDGAITDAIQTGPAYQSGIVCRVGNMYMLDDTGTENTGRFGKITVAQRSPVANVVQQLLKTAGATNAAVAGQAPLVAATYLYGDPGQQDTYSLANVAAGADVRGVRTTTVATKDDPFGYNVQPSMIVNGVEFERDEMDLTINRQYQHVIDEVDPSTGAKWTSTRLNNTTIKVEVVDNEGGA